MKRSFCICVLLSVIFTLSSCLFLPSEDSFFPSVNTPGSKTVTFVIDGEEETRTFSSSEKITYPEVPGKENYIFSGWYYDNKGNYPAYLGTSVSSDIKLYACWSYDYESALNEIFSEYIKGTVGISVEYRKSGFGFSASTQKVAGSGVIFREDNTYYYILTNDHVTEELEGYNFRTVTVTDCYGTSYDATLVASDAECDLSLLRIKKGDTALLALPLADSEAEVGDVVIAIGQPGGIDNSVTFGKVTKYAELSDGASAGNLGFPVIWHDAPMDHGSSGGVLMNDSFEIVGINYAVGTSSQSSEFLCGLAVGLSKINEFLSE